MMGSLYIGATGMKTHGEGLSTVGNNLANVNTVGYKQQSVLFADIFNQNLPIGSSGSQGFNQLGMGAQVMDARTLFTQGTFEPGNAVTDLSIGGKGFFQVSQGEEHHYTRAGNFRFTTTGLLNDPAGFTLTGMPLVDGKPTGTLEPVQLDTTSPEIAKSPSRVTSQIAAALNIGDSTSRSNDLKNPYFSLQSNWNGAREPALSTADYAYNQPLTVYDAEGTAHELNVYFDGAPSAGTGERIFEYAVAMNPKEDGSAAAGTPGAGLLMTGTLAFSGSGELKSMTGFTPTGTDNKDLTTW
ncbi:MAG: flagellar hook-basal body complex protein, partial [Bilophila sp.]